MTVKLHCPNFWGFERFYADTLKAPLEFRREDTEIVAAYGCFPGTMWNGGRPQSHDKIPYKRIEQEFDIYFNKIHLPIELVFNNLILTEDDLNDEYCNFIAKLGNEYGCSCTVTLPFLRDYLKENYPNLKLKRSCVACEDGKTWDLENWDTCVLDQFQGGNKELLDSIPANLRNRIELVANVECKDGCTQFYKHHRCMSRCQKFGESPIEYTCPLGKHYMPMYHARLQKHYISPEKALEYAKEGYEDFKLVSRCNLGQAVHETCFYYFKEEYVPDCVARSYIMFGLPMKIGLPTNYKLYFGNNDPLEGIE